MACKISALAVASIFQILISTASDAGVLSLQLVQQDAVTALENMYVQQTDNLSIACTPRPFDWEPSGILIACRVGNNSSNHLWLATAVRGETLGVTPLSSEAMQIAPGIGTKLSPFGKIVDIPTGDREAASKQASIVFSR